MITDQWQIQRVCTMKSLRIPKTVNYDNEHRTAHYMMLKFLSSVLIIQCCVALYWLWRPTCSNSNLLESWAWKKSSIISVLHNNTCRYFVDIWGHFFLMLKWCPKRWYISRCCGSLKCVTFSLFIKIDNIHKCRSTYFAMAMHTRFLQGHHVHMLILVC